ncbi:M1 family metallopeptidase [Chryseosolibacter indicus]|uniref:Aminopeptidase N n=1 Tax=Chryseosolibacter indicus TaxID=2782351 RepID=A0ABS5VQT7_9BACT|nr:M1 family metallopeptidase [Chryseosolibacter indicus]MBT1703162.1 M1 family metallopeptidase [Chryseosolibacter indicus]
MRIVLLVFWIIGFNAAASTPNRDIDIVHYKFELILNDSSDAITGFATVTIKFNKDLNQFSLDLTGKTPDGKGMEVYSLKQNNTPLHFNHRNGNLDITLKNEIKAGTQIDIMISYRGIPSDGLIISKNKYGDRTFFGDNWPNRAHHWLPVVDHPSDKASVEFIVTSPIHYEVVGSGIKTEESTLNEKQKLTHWKEDTPISTKVMVIGAARFAIQYAEEVDNIPVEFWVYPQNKSEGFRDYAAAPKMLKFFIDNIGPYAFKKLANVQSKTKYGGMENASNIFYFENSVTGNAQVDDLIAHEIAHQWFGNSASEADWNHIWLSEGFATYFTHLYNEHTYGKERRAKDMEKERQEVVAYFKNSPLPIVYNSLPENLIDILNANSYQKGSWVLHMLREEIGTEAFWTGIREYYRQYFNKNAETADFQRIMEKASGVKLDNFFKQWLYNPGHPILDVSWKYNAKTGITDISIEQKQTGMVFNFPLEVSFYGNDGEILATEKLKVDGKKNRFSVKTAQKTNKIQLDPGINLLFESYLRK